MVIFQCSCHKLMMKRNKQRSHFFCSLLHISSRFSLFLSGNIFFGDRCQESAEITLFFSKHTSIKVCSPVSPLITSNIVALCLSNQFIPLYRGLVKSPLLELPSIIMGLVSTNDFIDVLVIYWCIEDIEHFP